MCIALLGIVAASFQNKAALKKLRKEIQTKFLEKLYEKRIELYPEAFRISNRIVRFKKPDLDKQQEILLELNKWAGDAGLFLSTEVISAYYDLRKSLGNNPGNGEFYDDVQIEKSWAARTEFRAALRADIRTMHAAQAN